MKDFIKDVELELKRARSSFKDMTTFHEAYAVILEEFEEFWELVKKKTHFPAIKRDMYKKLVQVAAMTQRTVEDLKLNEVE